MLSGAVENLDWTYNITKTEGLVSSADLREAKEPRPAMHGFIDHNNLLGERLITLEGEMISSTEAGLVTLEQNLIDAFINDGSYYWLQWQRSGQVAKQVYCKVYTYYITDTYLNIKYYRPFLINFIASDPRIYSQTQHTETIHIASTAGGRGYNRWRKGLSFKNLSHKLWHNCHWWGKNNK